MGCTYYCTALHCMSRKDYNQENKRNAGENTVWKTVPQFIKASKQGYILAG